MEQPYLANVFISCSLRKEDKEFIDLVSNILIHYNFNPFGTVGLYDASTDNPTVLMEKNIDKCDFVVIAATKRYQTKDTHNSDKESNSLSEMIHTETGMAYAKSKPIVVFVEEGTNVGSFIPNITQYITLDKTQENLNSQINLIKFLLNDALQKVESARRNQAWKDLGNLLLKGLAAYGGLKLLGGNSTDDEDIEDIDCSEDEENNCDSDYNND